MDIHMNKFILRPFGTKSMYLQFGAISTIEGGLRWRSLKEGIYFQIVLDLNCTFSTFFPQVGWGSQRLKVVQRV